MYINKKTKDISMHNSHVKQLYNQVNTALGLRYPVLCLSNLIVYANSFCNAHCPFCDVGVKSEGGINRPNQDSPPYMSVELFSKILNDELVIKSKPRILFLMTEPLLNKELPILLKMAYNKGYKTSVTTNGFLLPQKAELIGSTLDVLQVSLDGLEQTHDSIRGKNFFLTP